MKSTLRSLCFVSLVSLLGCGDATVVQQTLTLPPEVTPRFFTVTNGTASNLTFTPAGGFSGVQPPITTNATLSGNLTVDSESNSLNLVVEENGRRFSLGVVSAEANPEPGSPIALLTPPDGTGSYAALVEFVVNGGIETITQAWSHSNNSQGNLTLNELTTEIVDLDFAFQQIEPDATSPVNATGSFSLAGHLRATLQQQAQP